MKILLATTVLFVFNVVAYGQVSISGKVVDGKNKPLEYATIVVKKDSVVVANAFTDSMGNYAVQNIHTGTYNMSCSFINDKIEFLLDVHKDTMVNIQLNTNKQLEQVTVAGKKPLIERKVDRLIFNVENSVTAIGGDALDAIGKAPGIRVLNNKIILVGKSSLSIMINNRLVQLSGDDLSIFLKSISADDIAKIEIITNPPAQYDAEGNSGLINIVTKRNTRLGYNGTARIGYIQSTYSTVFSGATLNYNTGKSKIYSILNLGKGSIAPIEESIIFYSNQTWQQINRRREYSKYINGTIGWDYQLTSKTLLGFNYSNGLYKPSTDESIKTPIFSLMKNIDSIIKTNAYTNRNTKYQTANIHLGQELDNTGKKIVVDADWYFHSDNNNRQFSNENYYADGQPVSNSSTQYLSASNQEINVYTLNTALELPYKTFTLSLGGKLTFIKNESDVNLYQWLNNQYQIDNAKSNNFNYTENTQALFINFSKTIKKWDIQTGIRSEETQTKGISFSTPKSTNNYFKIFPTAFLTYNANDKNSFSLTYGKRINRPSYSKLNPFRWYNNSYAYSEGNPFLQPSFNNNIELSHTYNNFLTTILSFSDENNRYDQLTFVDNNSNSQVTKYLNFLKSYNYQLSTSISYAKIKWLESNNQFQVFYSLVNSSILQTQASVKGWGGYISSDNQIVLNKSKTIIVGINFWYQFPYIDGLDNSSSYYNIDATIKFLFLKKKLQVSINGNDILKSNKPKYYSLFDNIKQLYNNYYDNQQVKISLRYKFGNQKIKREERQLNNSEETKRMN